MLHLVNVIRSDRFGRRFVPSEEPAMKTFRRSLFALALALGATGCSTSAILSPDCEDPAACEYQPGTGSDYQPGSGS